MSRARLAGLSAAIFAALILTAPLARAAVKVQEAVSAKGITAWLVEDHTNPIISVNFAFRGGSALDPDGKDGVANLVSATLDEGAGDMDSETFQRRLEDLSISLSFSAGLDTFSGRMRTLTRNRDDAFGLLKLAITRPRFDPEAVERIRSQVLAGLRRASENPRRLANRAMFQTMFPDHPYSRPTDGTLETVPVIKIADLKAFAVRRLARDNLVIGVVGDITAAELKTLLDTTFGELPAAAESWDVPDVTAAANGRRVLIEKPIPQSVIRFGHAGIKREDPDFYAAYVMNYVLGGGGFESRLHEEVREKRGLAYSAFSYLAPLDHSALIVGGAGTANAQASRTIDIVRAEWKRMAEQGLSEPELKDAKTYLTGSYALRFGSSPRIAAMLTGVQLENLGPDFFDIRNSLIEKVTLGDVNRVAKSLLRPENLTLVVVGQPENFSAD